MQGFRTFLLAALILLPCLVRADDVDDYIHAEMTRQRIPGLVLGVVRDGKLVRKQAYGMADLELGVPTRPDMLFEIGSATKSFTAMAVMMLTEAGKLSLDAPVSKYLDDLPASWQPITLRQLLNHTSGLPEYATDPAYTITEEIDRKKMLEAMGKLPLDFAPGSAYSYTNLGFFLLGMVIEKVSGQSYETFVQERILTPLGMTHTRSLDPDVIVPERAARYLSNAGKIINCKPTQPTSAFSAGLLLSNIEDMAKWESALRDRKLLKPASYEALWTPLKLQSGGTRPYGLGWFVSKQNGHRVIWHPGNSAGYSATITRFPDDNLAVIVLLNLYPINADGLARGVATRLVPALAPALPQEQPDPDAKRTERLRAALNTLVEGELSPDVFAAEFRAPLATSRGRMQRQGMAVFKEITRFAYAGMEKADGNTVYLYRALTPKRNFTVRFALLPDGKISDVIAQADPLPLPPAKPGA